MKGYKHLWGMVADWLYLGFGIMYKKVEIKNQESGWSFISLVNKWKLVECTMQKKLGSK